MIIKHTSICKSATASEARKALNTVNHLSLAFKEEIYPEYLILPWILRGMPILSSKTEECIVCPDPCISLVLLPLPSLAFLGLSQFSKLLVVVSFRFLMFSKRSSAKWLMMT